MGEAEGLLFGVLADALSSPCPSLRKRTTDHGFVSPWEAIPRLRLPHPESTVSRQWTAHAHAHTPRTCLPHRIRRLLGGNLHTIYMSFMRRSPVLPVQILLQS